MVVSEEFSWKTFRGNVMRTGTSSSNLSRRPSLQRVMELGPMVASPVFDNSIVYAATIKGTAFLGKNLVLALNAKTGEQVWSFEIDGDIFSSPCIIQDMIIVGSMNKN